VRDLDVLPAGSKWAIIVDIDGTLADNEHRRHFVEGVPRSKRDFKSFNAMMHKDAVCKPVATIINLLSRMFSILLVSGRGEEYRRITEKWLKRNFIKYDMLYMRPAKDNRPDTMIKLEILEQIKQEGYAPHLAIDDRNRCVKMWRDAGITCFQVADGDF